MLTPQTGLNKLSLSYHSNGVGHLECCFDLFVVKKRVLCPEVEQKVHLVGTVKLYCLSLHNNFFLKFFGHGKSPWYSEMLFGLGLKGALCFKKVYVVKCS